MEDTAAPTDIPTTFIPTYMPTKTAPTFLPTSSCGNKLCDANESSSNCPSDCVDLTLVTTYDYDYETSCHGNMFSVYSRDDVVITSLAISSMNQGEGAVKVYTRHGSYTGYEQRSDKWKKIYDNPSLTLNGTGQPTQLGEMISDVSLPIGSYQSFYVWAEKKLVYKRGTVGMEHSPSNFDESLVVFEGIAMYSPSIWSETSVIYSPRIWSGTIHYSASAE